MSNDKEPEMSAPTHVYEIFVKASPQRVWQAITDPDYTRRYFHRTAIESTFEPGAGYRYVLPDGSGAIDGTIEEVEPEQRLVMTWHTLYDAALAEEPVSRVEWTLTPANDDATVTRVTLRHLDLARSPGTWANVRLGWVGVLDSMKTLLETGDELGAVDTGDGPVADDVFAEWHRAQGGRGQQLDVGAARRSLALPVGSRRSARTRVRVDVPLGAGGRSPARQRGAGFVARVAGARGPRPR